MALRPFGWHIFTLIYTDFFNGGKTMQIDKYREVKVIEADTYSKLIEEVCSIAEDIPFKEPIVFAQPHDKVTIDIRILVEHKEEK